MARNGSGAYVQPVADFVSGALIKSADVNSWLGDLGSEITNSIAKDGQTTPTADLPMGGFKHTNVDDATATNQYASLGQVGFEKFADAALTAVAAIDVTWTAGLYRAVRVHLINFAGSVSNNATEALRLRCSAAGTFVTGTAYTFWGAEQESANISHLASTGQTAAWIKGFGQLGTTDSNEAEIFVCPGGVSEATTIRSAASGIGYVTTGTNVQSFMSGRMDAQASAVDGIRLLWNTGGTFAARGRIVAFGLRA